MFADEPEIKNLENRVIEADKAKQEKEEQMQGVSDKEANNLVSKFKDEMGKHGW